MNEMTRLERFRSEVPRPGPSDLRAEEDRLLAAMLAPEPAAPRPRRRTRLRLAAVTAGVAAASVTAGLVVADPGGSPHRVPSVRTMPAAHVELLQHAADAASRTPELHPRPGQFLVYRSLTMDPVESNSGHGRTRYLARTERTIWLPVNDDATHGVLQTDPLPPEPFPGETLPPEARNEARRTGPEKAADFDHRAEWLRTDYAYLSRLPADPAGMYRHLYSHLGTGPSADGQAWQNVGSMLTEAYLPAAQRKALFRAAAAIPGVRTVGRAVDAAGRAGIAVSLDVPGSGQRDEYIFAPKTYLYLGRRTVVTNASRAHAPLGTVLTSTAQLSIHLTNHAPTVKPH
ncbi:CU044_5270 family protein [Actinomadura opuntiae]|uniref:CU044_5270 family protein n=1 Tax=Actinomadura sp. OS1-43 TaxID=604315 RepID=UPI00255AC536|nr:CU044_5270 family protein [Actinomadura sp. OS1-43]MDL4821198.1 CU044_5270 family protein [Actinomadura sp. OS1-43]